MIKDKVVSLLKEYSQKMQEYGYPPKELDDCSLLHVAAFRRFSHIAWMCEQAQVFDDVEKAMRWLGFIQGVLWMDSFYTINEMREHNRNGNTTKIEEVSNG